MADRKSKKTIRVGGCGRSFALAAPHVGMELVALCDTWEERLTASGAQLGVATERALKVGPLRMLVF